MLIDPFLGGVVVKLLLMRGYLPDDVYYETTAISCMGKNGRRIISVGN
jgi:hypothetical protein